MLLVEPSTEQQEMFKAIAPSATGRILSGYIKKLINELADIRTIKGVDKEKEILAREAAIEILQVNILNKLNTLKGNNLEEEEENYQ